MTKTDSGGNDKDPILREYASPPCLMHEFEPAPPDNSALLEFLDELIEGERAGARAIVEMIKEVDSPDTQALLRGVAEDEARFCAMLSHHAERLGGTPSRAVGTFAEKLLQRTSLTDRLALLNKGQSVVVRMLDDAIADVTDLALRKDLIDMKEVHHINIDRCSTLLGHQAGG